MSGGKHSLYAGQKLLSILEEDDPVTHWQKVAASDLNQQAQACPLQFLVGPKAKIVLAQINLRVRKEGVRRRRCKNQQCDEGGMRTYEGSIDPESIPASCRVV